MWRSADVLGRAVAGSAVGDGKTRHCDAVGAVHRDDDSVCGSIARKGSSEDDGVAHGEGGEELRSRETKQSTVNDTI
jgi:hypothetical protein